ncbi:MAG: DNA-3-methyladenine glycosylase family protein [Thermoanaerobaculia bacterium]
MTRIGIPLPPHFSFDAVVRSHGWYDLPPFVYDQAAGVLKTALTPALSRGEREAAPVTFRASDGSLRASSPGLSGRELRRLAARVFSLDVDLSDFARAVQDPALRSAVLRGGGRMLRAPTLFEDAVKMLLTTTCSWEATRGMITRLIAAAGAGGSAFPSPDAVAALSARLLRERVRCGYRAQALLLFARRVASGRLDLAAWEDSARPARDVREEILGERGFGPYAAEGLLRILGRHEFLALDSWSRQKYRRLYPGPARATDRSIARRYARFGRFRGLALWLELTGDWREAQERL